MANGCITTPSTSLQTNPGWVAYQIIPVMAGIFNSAFLNRFRALKTRNFEIPVHYIIWFWTKDFWFKIEIDSVLNWISEFTSQTSTYWLSSTPSTILLTNANHLAMQQVARFTEIVYFISFMAFNWQWICWDFWFTAFIYGWLIVIK